MSEVSGSDNRRAAYRVQPGDEDGLDLEMLGRRQRISPARVADIAAGGACLHVDGDVAGALAQGEELDVALSSRRHAFDGQVRARVVASQHAHDVHVLHLAFFGDTWALGASPGLPHDLLNRRSTYRAGDAPDGAQVSALAAPRGGGPASLQAVPVAVRNISNSGVCLELDRATHALLENHGGLALTFELPGQAEPVRVMCRVRYRAADGDGFVYGCEYDWSATSDSLGAVEDLVSWIFDEFEGGIPG